MLTAAPEARGARRSRSPARRRTAAFVLAIAGIALGGGADGASQRPAELPLGPRSLDERRISVELGPGVRFTRILRRGRGRVPGWRVYVLTIDRTALRGHVSAVLSNGRIPRRERVSSMARRARAIAAVNGGFFVPPGRTNAGDPIGTLAIGGDLLSEPVGDRTSLLIPESSSARARIARVRFLGGVTIGDRRRLVDGVNRRRGRIPACGGRGGDRPTERPNAALTCSDDSELVVYSSAFGPRTRTARGGVEAVLEGGVVRGLRRGGDSRIPSGGLVLSGSGDAAAFLAAAARSGARARLGLELLAARSALRLRDYAAIVGAGPRLLARGRVRIDSGAEGYHGSVYRSFVLSRNPRTLAGVTADGTLLLVAIDGRRPGWSAGATLREAAAVMRALGAREAMNLDGGGSTTMTVGARVVNRPSDPGGERPVGDAIVVLP